jgi:hypothetical protein
MPDDARTKVNGTERNLNKHDAGVEDIVNLEQTGDQRLGEPISFLCLSASDRRVASLIA